MPLDFPIIDFHAHLRGPSPVRLPQPASGGVYLKEIANLVEPLTRQVAGLYGMHFRDPFSRFLYRSIQHYANHEILRVFEKYDVEQLLETMARHGISHTVVCPIEPFFDTEDVAEAIAPYPDRLSLFASAEPREELGVERLEALLRRVPVAGLKLTPAREDAPGETRRMYDLLGLARDRDLPVFVHSGAFPFEAQGTGEASRLAPVLAAFPHLSFTIAHMGWDHHAEILDLAERHHHVSVETSWQPPKILRAAVDKLGAHRVLWGSDFPLLQPGVSLEHAATALSQDELRIVCARNAHRLLGVRV